ncbi:hypothetical protein CON70_03380 [Bacillus pseudomycoides]|jgi:hypothetical protein|nr:hypothetical protein CON70_03380 [Bacillus pseudomycoides]
MGTYTISTILGDITVYQGVAPHRHQAKIIKYPPNGNFLFFIAPKFIFIIFGKNVFLNLIAMWHYPFYKDNQNLEIIFLVENSYSK